MQAIFSICYISPMPSTQNHHGPLCTGRLGRATAHASFCCFSNRAVMQSLATKSHAPSATASEVWFASAVECRWWTAKAWPDSRWLEIHSCSREVGTESPGRQDPINMLSSSPTHHLSNSAIKLFMLNTGGKPILNKAS